jgi:hypothetical protein
MSYLYVSLEEICKLNASVNSVRTEAQEPRNTRAKPFMKCMLPTSSHPRCGMRLSMGVTQLQLQCLCVLTSVRDNYNVIPYELHPDMTPYLVTNVSRHRHLYRPSLKSVHSIDPYIVTCFSAQQNQRQRPHKIRHQHIRCSSGPLRALDVHDKSSPRPDP